MNRHFNELKVPEGQGRVLADITASPILFFNEANGFLDYLFYGLLRSFRPPPVIFVGKYKNACLINISIS